MKFIKNKKIDVSINKYHKGSIYSIDWSNNNKLIVTSSLDRTIKVSKFEEDEFLIK